MKNNIFEKINQISVLAQEARFKIALVLFNSQFTVNNIKLGLHSCSTSELEQIIDVSSTDLQYHLDVMLNSNLIEKVPEARGYYHITEQCKEILNIFGVNETLVKKIMRNQ